MVQYLIYKLLYSLFNLITFLPDFTDMEMEVTQERDAGYA